MIGLTVLQKHGGATPPIGSRLERCCRCLFLQKVRLCNRPSPRAEQLWTPWSHFVLVSTDFLKRKKGTLARVLAPKRAVYHVITSQGGSLSCVFQQLGHDGGTPPLYTPLVLVLDPFQFLEDVSPLIQEASSAPSNWTGAADFLTLCGSVLTESLRTAVGC